MRQNATMQTIGSTEDRKSILKRISALQPTSLRKWEHMNVNQMICHLNDSFNVGMGERTCSDATGPVQRTLVKWIALWLPVPWPKGLSTRPEIEQGAGGTPPTDFTLVVPNCSSLWAGSANSAMPRNDLASIPFSASFARTNGSAGDIRTPTIISGNLASDPGRTCRLIVSTFRAA